MCARLRSGRAARRVRMSLSGFWLHHGLRGGCAAPETEAVAGATPLPGRLACHGGGLGCARHPNPLREVAPGPAVPCGKAKRQAEMGPVSTAVGDAVKPTGQPVGQQARHLLEAALDTLPDGSLAGSTPRRPGGDGAVRLHPPRCRLRHAEMGGRSQPRPRSADRHRRPADRNLTAYASATCMTEAVSGRTAISCPATSKVNRTRRTCHQHPRPTLTTDLSTTLPNRRAVKPPGHRFRGRGEPFAGYGRR